MRSSVSLRIGQGQQIVEIDLAMRRPGEMLGEAFRLDSGRTAPSAAPDARGRAALRRRSTGRRHAPTAQSARAGRAASHAAVRPRPCSFRHGFRQSRFRCSPDRMSAKCCGLKPMPGVKWQLRCVKHVWRVRKCEDGDPSPVAGGGTKQNSRNAQLLIGASEPMPFGVFIAAQVPLATYFQALP